MYLFGMSCENCRPETTSFFVTSNIPPDGVCGPPPPPRFAVFDDGNTNPTSDVVELLLAHALIKVATITSPLKPMRVLALRRRTCK